MTAIAAIRGSSQSIDRGFVWIFSGVVNDANIEIVATNNLFSGRFCIEQVRQIDGVYNAQEVKQSSG